jgi:hypothetical protein
MSRVPRSLLLALVIGLAVPALGAAKLPEGSWKLSMLLPNGTLGVCILKIESKNDKLGGEVLAAHPQMGNMTVSDIAQEGDLIRMVMKSQLGEQKVEGKMSAKDERTVLGSLQLNGRLFPCKLEATDQTKLAPQDLIKPVNIPGLQRAQQLVYQPVMLRNEARQETDAEKKKDLLQKADEAEKKAQVELPKICEEILDKHADSASAFIAATMLLRLQAKAKADPQQLKATAEAADKAAEPYGPTWQKHVETELATNLVNMGAAPEVALAQAEAAVKHLRKHATPEQQARVLMVLQYAQQLAGKGQEAKETAAKVAGLDAGLDREYLDKTPPFKPEPYEGRKGKGDRAVVMELFSGSQCPPCVAADVALHALAKAYKPDEVILLEYHEHIPGPDALANAASVARMEYYLKAFPMEVGGTPTTVFDGKPEAGGGGPVQASKEKYDQYRKILDDRLEKPADAKLTATATRKGDTIDIQVKVDGLKEAGEDTRLRLAVVEQMVRYVGANGVRFHHHVVRDLPDCAGGPKGVALTTADSSHQFTVSVKELRRKLTEYLQDYTMSQQPFPTVQRPLELKNLHVVAFIQDDKTHKILQGVWAHVKGDEKEGE